MTDDHNNVTVALPAEVYRTLRAAFPARTASLVLRQWLNGMPTLHPGDQFGRVVCWLWRTDPGEAILLLAEYLGALFETEPEAADVDPPLTFEAAMRGLRHVIDDDIDFDRLVATARREVPEFYAGLIGRMESAAS